MLINIIILSLILCASTGLVGKVICSMTGLNDLRQVAKSLSNGAIFRSLCTVGGIGIDSNISNLLILRSIFNPYVKHRLRPKHHIIQLSSLGIDLFKYVFNVTIKVDKPSTITTQYSYVYRNRLFFMLIIS